LFSLLNLFIILITTRSKVIILYFKLASICFICYCFLCTYVLVFSRYIFCFMNVFVSLQYLFYLFLFLVYFYLFPVFVSSHYLYLSVFVSYLFLATLLIVQICTQPFYLTFWSAKLLKQLSLQTPTKLSLVDVSINDILI
jgi:hypothetical protein